jgi:hypothetical protein
VLDIARLEFNNKSSNEVFTLSRQLSDKVLKLDSNMERSIKFKSELHHILVPYKEINKELERKRNKNPSETILSLQTPGTSNRWNA